MAAEEQSHKIEAFVKQVETWEIPEGDKLLEYLNEDLRSHLKRHVKLFQQCKSMERLESPEKLSDKISELPETCQFYIGYTGAIDKPYLWTTSPKSKKWKLLCSAGKAPVKTHTYFTHLNEDVKLTEHALIKKWKKKKKEQCLNRKNYGEKTKKGIVYVLVYEYDDPREDVDRLCQKLKEGGLKDKAFREKTEDVQEVTVLGRQPEEESDTITESPVS